MPSRKRIGLLLSILLLEVFLCIGFWSHWKKPIAGGFLIKDGNRYIVAWKGSDTQYQTETYLSLGQALRFAKEELNLSEGHNSVADMQLEHLWVDRQFGNFVVFWKTVRFSALHQLSFQSREDAKYFADAFRKGAYAPSPFGHSVILSRSIN